MPQPNWRSRGPEHLPPFPERIVRRMLREFGVDPQAQLDPWPCGPSDVLARFAIDGRPHLMKGRHIEHRGELSLYETHRLQRLLGAEGLPVPSLVESPSGETLLRGANWEREGDTLYYEIQPCVPGERLPPTPDNLRRAGQLIALFHQVGARIDTFLLNKSTYIGVFRQRGFEARERLEQQLLGCQMSTSERKTVDALFKRFGHPCQDVYLDWRIVHGDLSAENLLANGDGLVLVDWDEVGLCPKTSDHGDLLMSLPKPNEELARAIVEGYYEEDGTLTRAELQSIHDGMVVGCLAELASGSGTASAGDALERYAFLLDS